MPYGTDFTNLVANYTTSPIALVKVGSTVQQTNVTSNNFTNPVQYVVRSADETKTNTYTIKTEIANSFPTDITISCDTINELKRIGSKIGYFETADIDLLDVHTYSLVAGTGDADNSAFTIDGDSLKTAIRFDYETKNLYSIRVKTNDNNGGTFEKVFQIQIKDYYEKITISCDTIIEIAPKNSTIGGLMYTDTLNAPHVFTLVSGVGSTDNSNFKIVGDSLVSNSLFDYETKEFYSIRVQANDNLGALYQEVLSIRIIDYFEDMEISVDTILETVNINSFITKFSNSDTLNIPHYYSLISGVGDTDNSSFKISNDTLYNTIKFDYETKTSYSIRTQVADNLGWTYEESYTFNIIDQNDEVPISAANSTTDVDENIGNQIVFNIIATDADFSPEFKILKYKQVDTLTNTNFEVDENLGIIKIINPVDYEIDTQFPLSIEISDGLNITTVGVLVKINDLNDEIPVILDTILTFQDNTILETELIQFEATDRDANSNLTFSISDDFDGTFELSSDGLLVLKKYFDYDTKNLYEFNITVSDGDNER